MKVCKRCVLVFNWCHDNILHMDYHSICGFCKTNIDRCCSGEISREGCPTLSHTQHRFKSYSVAQSLECEDMPKQLDFGCQVMPKWHDSPR